MKTVLVWAARAAGLSSTPVRVPLIARGEEALARAQMQHRDTDQLVVQLEQMERELRRRGQLPRE